MAQQASPTPAQILAAKIEADLLALGPNPSAVLVEATITGDIAGSDASTADKEIALNMVATAGGLPAGTHDAALTVLAVVESSGTFAAGGGASGSSAFSNTSGPSGGGGSDYSLPTT